MTGLHRSVSRYTTPSSRNICFATGECLLEGLSSRKRIHNLKQKTPCRAHFRDHTRFSSISSCTCCAMVLAVAFAPRIQSGDGGRYVFENFKLTARWRNHRSLSEAMTEEILMDGNGMQEPTYCYHRNRYNVHAIPEQKDIQGTELDLMVSPVVDPAIYPAPDKVYHFFPLRTGYEGFSQTMHERGDRIYGNCPIRPMEDAYAGIATKVGEKKNGRAVGILTVYNKGFDIPWQHFCERKVHPLFSLFV